MKPAQRRKKLYARLFTSIVVVCVVAGCVRRGASPEALPEALNVTSVGLVALEPLFVLGVVIDANRTVLYIEPRSGAEAAGIVVGDVIDSINGVTIAQDVQKAKDEIRYTTQGQKVVVRGERNGQSFTIDVEPLAPGTGTPQQDGPILTATPIIAPNDYL